MPKRIINPNKYPDTLDVSLSKALNLYKSNHFHEALTLIAKITNNNERYPLQVIKIRATINHKLRNYEDAFRDICHILQQEPSNVVYLNARGHIYRKHGKHDPRNFTAAHKDLTESIRLQPNAFAYKNRGEVFLQLGQFDNAIADFTQAIKLKPNSSSALSKRGNAYLQTNQLDKALTDLNQAIQLRPDNLFILLSRAEAYLLQKDLDKALTDFTAAIAMKPQRAVLYLKRADIYYQQGKLLKAIKNLEEGFPFINSLEVRSYYTELRGKVYKAQEKNAQRSYIQAMENSRLTMMNPPAQVPDAVAPQAEEVVPVIRARKLNFG